jgi:hypothetical protein
MAGVVEMVCLVVEFKTDGLMRGFENSHVFPTVRAGVAVSSLPSCLVVLISTFLGD